MEDDKKILKIGISFLVLFLISLVIYNYQNRRKLNISYQDYINIKNKVQNKKITNFFLITFTVLSIILACSIGWYFLLILGLPGTAAMLDKPGNFIHIVFKVWFCESIIFLLVLIVNQILLTKYLNKIKKAGKLNIGDNKND